MFLAFIRYNNKIKSINIFNEETAIVSIKEYLTQCIRDNKLAMISNSLYMKYIETDNKLYMKTIRKMFIIYGKKIRELKQRCFLKFKLRSILLHNKNNNTNKLNYFKYNDIIHNYKHKHFKTKNIKANNSMIIKPYNDYIEPNYNYNKKKNPNTYRISLNKSMYHQFPVLNDLYNISVNNKLNSSVSSNLKCNNNNSTNISPTKNIKRSQSAININKPNNNIKYIHNNYNNTSKYYNNKHNNLFNELYKDNQKRKEKLRQISLNKEKQFNSLYTFTPELISKDRTPNNLNGNFINRLDHYAKNKRTNLQKIINDIEENTPKPKSINRKIPLNQSHLISLSKNYKKHKKDKVDSITNEMFIEHDITFKPLLNTELNNKLIKNTFSERNEDFIKQKQIHRYNLSKEHEIDYSFQPQINEYQFHLDNKNMSTSNINNITAETSSRKVCDRLYEYRKLYKDNLEIKKQFYAQTHPFKPTISKNTDEILRNKQKLIEAINQQLIHNEENNNSNTNNTNTNNINVNSSERCECECVINETHENSSKVNGEDDNDQRISNKEGIKFVMSNENNDVNDYEEKLQLKSKNKNRAYNNILNDSKRIKTNTISGGNVSSGGKFPTFGSVGNNSGGVYYFEMGGNVCQGKKSLMNNMNYYYENL